MFPATNHAQNYASIIGKGLLIIQQSYVLSHDQPEVVPTPHFPQPKRMKQRVILYNPKAYPLIN